MRSAYKFLYKAYLMLSILLASTSYASTASTIDDTSQLPVNIILWHSLAGHLGEEVRALADAFNKRQHIFVIKPVYKGGYIEGLTNFAAAFQAKTPPALVQIFDVGTPTMLHPPGIIKPVETLMNEQKISLPLNSFMPAIRQFYSQDNKLMAMPFNISIPVMYYNVEALQKAGYKEEDFPKTWKKLEQLVSKFKQSGYQCAYTTAHPAWILIESFSAIHGLSIFNKNTTKAIYNTPQLISHLKRLQRWANKGYFEYSGREDNGVLLFTGGNCPLYSGSSGSYQSLGKMVNFKMGVARMPLDTQLSKVRHNTLIGGAALWVVAGQPEKIEQGIAQFFSFLAEAETQNSWFQKTGYLPLGLSGVYHHFGDTPMNGLLAFTKNEISQKPQCFLNTYQPILNQIRMINDEALEAMFAGMKSPKQALDDAVNRANLALNRFNHNTNKEFNRVVPPTF